MTNQSAGIASLEKPELVFGLVGAIGTDLEYVSKVLCRSLQRVGYKPIEIRVSQLIHEVTDYRDLGAKPGPEDERIETYMRVGTLLREKSGRDDFMALLAIAEIRRIRQAGNQVSGSTESEEILSSTPLEATAYVLRSLKNPAEIEILRQVYGRGLHVISAYSPRPTRCESLVSVFRKSDPGKSGEDYRARAEKLIQVDESEGYSFGQNVRTSFPLADLFVDVRHKKRLTESIDRFISALFGHQFLSPTIDEQSMFFANASALRSADLARQVGAAIVGQDGEIIAIGCNEVPKFGGGLYWPDGPEDHRDFQVGLDSSDGEKRNLVSELLGRLGKAGWLSKQDSGAGREELVEELLYGESKDILKGTQLLSVIEFGRSVHAEMAAITDAARRGVSTLGKTLYCTTFPCHLCARHIIAAGIRRVVYVEPYPKSLAARLYKDSMVVDPEDETPNKVRFEPFVGVAPKLYRFLFTASAARKATSGQAKEWDRDVARPRLRRIVPSYLKIEEIAVLNTLQKVVDTAKLGLVRRTG